jgi:hypothetical protein
VDIFGRVISQSVSPPRSIVDPYQPIIYSNLPEYQGLSPPRYKREEKYDLVQNPYMQLEKANDYGSKTLNIKRISKKD